MSQDRIQALSTQNNELRTLLAQHTAHDSGSSSGAGSLEDSLSRKDEMLATLSASVRQLELERDQLLEQLSQSEKPNKETAQRMCFIIQYLISQFCIHFVFCLHDFISSFSGF